MKPSSTEPGTSSPPDAPGGASAAGPDVVAPDGAEPAAEAAAPAVAAADESAAPAAARAQVPAQRDGQVSGTRRRPRAEGAGLSELPLDRPGVTATDRQVRPARLDRQLRRGAIDPMYSDRHLEGGAAKAAGAARETARAEGYAAGWAEGRQAAAEQARQQALALAEQAAARLEK